MLSHCPLSNHNHYQVHHILLPNLDFSMVRYHHNHHLLLNILLVTHKHWRNLNHNGTRCLHQMVQHFHHYPMFRISNQMVHLNYSIQCEPCDIHHVNTYLYRKLWFHEYHHCLWPTHRRYTTWNHHHFQSLYRKLHSLLWTFLCMLLQIYQGNPSLQRMMLQSQWLKQCQILTL